MARAAIVIPLYGRSDLTEACHASLEAAGDDIELVLVDNASRDDTPQVLARLASDATVIRNRTNLGFATACNQGATAAESEVVVFLNNDTEVLPGWLDPLLDELRDPTVGAVGSRLLYPNGRVQHAGMALSPGATPLHLHRGAPGGHPAVTARRDLTLVTGACLAMRRADFLDLGGFDPAFKNGYEDCDLCLRTRRSGLRVRYAGDSVVIHHEGQSDGRMDWESENSRLLRRRWRGWPSDLGELLARDGVTTGYWADSIWVGPLFDGSPQARDAQAAIVRLGQEGRRPFVAESPALGRCHDDCAPEVLAGLNRLFLPNANVLRWEPSETRDGRGLGIQVPTEHYVAAMSGEPEMDERARRALSVPPPAPGVRWVGWLAGRSGYASASRATLAAGRDAGVSFLVSSVNGLDGNGRRMDDVPSPLLPCATVVHAVPDTRVIDQVAEQIAGTLTLATCFETEGLPSCWAEPLGRADQIWVPSRFNLRTFAAGGVPEERLRLVPYAIDCDHFRPEPAASGGPRDQIVLTSVFEWTWRKGWDLLIRAWVEEFSPEEPVTLRLLTYRGSGALGPGGDIVDQLTGYLSELGRSPDSIPDIELLTEPLSDAGLLELYRSSDAFVLPTRGEGAGLPVLEAMAVGVPTIATARGGHEDVMDEDLAFPVAVERLVEAPAQLLHDNPAYAGQMLAEPSLASLRRQLRLVVDDPAEARRRAARGRDAVRDLFGYEAVGRTLVERIEELLDVAPAIPVGR